MSAALKSFIRRNVAQVADACLLVPSIIGSATWFALPRDVWLYGYCKGVIVAEEPDDVVLRCRLWAAAAAKSTMCNFKTRWWP